MPLTLDLKKPKQSLNKSYLKNVPVDRVSFDKFKEKLIKLQAIDKSESEENIKNHLAEFLKDTFYKGKHEINTKGRTDLVIHADNTAQSPVNVLLEVKKPSNKSEMITKDQLNAKAMQELILYYLRERETEHNTDIKYLLITDTEQFFIFEASDFERLFHHNKKFLKDFKEWQAGKKSSSNTDFFYTDIAKPYLASLESEIAATYFNIQDYKDALEGKGKEEKLLALYKLFSPEHLLKTYAYDSNKLNQGFYEELLHIIGLQEVKQKGKKLIERKGEKDRDYGSLLENTITVLESSHKLDILPKPERYGASESEQIYSIALELVITWVNRILFLKLLEGQLINFHQGDIRFKFLDKQNLNDFDDLYKLFFQVLAKVPEKRRKDIQAIYQDVPYLNSSLFEITELEKYTESINALDDTVEMPYFAKTVLVDNKGKRANGKTLAFEYLLRFLEAYDFSAEGQEGIKDHQKELINASVLGLIFEKINGYKDGSFYTPGFITMYMARETLRKTVLDKFNAQYQWNCPDFESLRNYFDVQKISEYNDLINSIKVCDPAVGSGHFLVSVLNEFLAIKSDLKILQDTEGKRIQYHQVVIDNDELSITDEYGDPFEYAVKYENGKRQVNLEKQRLQASIFREKQYLIENCLFGVDINPNSVKICRLRLWIELLKHTFYKPDTDYQELEVLPNLDINIKAGNSLISRFALDADLKEALKKSKWTIKSYQNAVASYRQAKNYEEKRELRQLIASIKENFSSEITRNDPERKRLSKVAGELQSLLTQQSLIEETAKQQAAKAKKQATLEKEIAKLEQSLKEREEGKIYDNAFEWRFEFPEILNEQGDFVGFDVVIGNPPYFVINHVPILKLAEDKYKVYDSMGDIYTLFFEQGINLLKNKGKLAFITANKWLKANYGKKLRIFFKEHALKRLVDFGDLPVFEEASAYPAILELAKSEAQKSFEVAVIPNLDFQSLHKEIDEQKYKIELEKLDDSGWALNKPEISNILEKIQKQGVLLDDYIQGMAYYGIKTGLNEAFVIDKTTKDFLIKDEPQNQELIKPFTAGRDIKYYAPTLNGRYIIIIPKGWTKEKFGNGTEQELWKMFEKSYPKITKHLINFREKAKTRYDKGDFWWELRACDYYDMFEKPKIMYQVFQVTPAFTLDKDKVLTNNAIWIIPKEDKYLLAHLNSKLGWFLISQYCTQIRNGYQLIYKYLSRVPIKQIDQTAQQPFIEKVEKILSLKKANPEADTSDLEKEIDAMVYALYGLSEEEIEIVEKS